MIRTLGNGRLISAVLLGAVVLALAVGPAGALDSTALASHGTGALAGFGFWDVLACVGCIAGFAVGAGTTIAGFAVFIAANPELAVLCVSSCGAAM